MNNQKIKNYFSIREVADLLNISRQAVLKKINNGQIKGEKVGRNFIIQKDDIKGYLTTELTSQVKMQIDNGVAEVIKQYGEVLKKLGEE